MLELLVVQGTLKSLLQHHSSKVSILWHSDFFKAQLSYPYMTTGNTIALGRWTFVGKVMSLLFNMLSRLVITFLPRSAAAAKSLHDASVMSNSVRPHRWQPTRLRHPWDSPGKNTGVGCRFLLQCVKVKSESEVAQSCWTLCDPMDCSTWDSPGKSTGVGCHCLLHSKE